MWSRGFWKLRSRAQGGDQGLGTHPQAACVGLEMWLKGTCLLRVMFPVSTMNRCWWRQGATSVVLKSPTLGRSTRPMYWAPSMGRPDVILQLYIPLLIRLDVQILSRTVDSLTSSQLSLCVRFAVHEMRALYTSPVEGVKQGQARGLRRVLGWHYRRINHANRVAEG